MLGSPAPTTAGPRLRGPAVGVGPRAPSAGVQASVRQGRLPSADASECVAAALRSPRDAVSLNDRGPQRVSQVPLP
ncbi:Uncharacterised protein [Mycobacteroides abscessus subsp. abscessus]|nr:Uncharacterised protein [Mycobacteroides abscessus subsp. abscessus]